MAGGERGDRSPRDGDIEERERLRRDSERGRRLERAEARRQERRARAAAAKRKLEDGDSSDDTVAGSGDGPGAVSTALRFAALALLPVGFIGMTVSEAWLAPAESPYALVFGAGVVCAIVSIYLAILRHDAA